MRRSSAYLPDILSNLDPKIESNASSLGAVISGFEDKVLKEPLVFEVGDYEVVVEARGSRSNPDLRLTCTCKYWQYQGPEYHASQEDYLYGTTRGTADFPEKRDPNGTHKVCKHAYAVLRDFFGA